MDYEKAYKEALERAREIYHRGSIKPTADYTAMAERHGAMDE